MKFVSQNSRLLMLTLLLLATFVCLSLSSCGGEDDADAEADGDGESSENEFADGDGEADVEIAPDLTTEYDGLWEMLETNAVDWYNVRELTGVYLHIENGVHNWWLPRADEVGCITKKMVRKDAHKFVPALDADNCWYSLTIGDLDRLTIDYRNAAMQSPEPIKFLMQPLEEIPGYDMSLCVEDDTCQDYGEPFSAE